MKQLIDYVDEQNSIELEENEIINEGFLMNAVTKRTLRRMDPEDLLTGILNMYDYIVDEDDIKLFYKDFDVKERLFWKNLYNLYTKKVWSIVDMDVDLNSRDRDDENDLRGNKKILKEITPELNKLIDVTPEFRRYLRKIINQSRNDKLELKPSEPQYIMSVPDKLLDKVYIFTINRTTGLRSVFRPIDAKFLKEVFEKIGLSQGKHKNR